MSSTRYNKQGLHRIGGSPLLSLLLNGTNILVSPRFRKNARTGVSLVLFGNRILLLQRVETAAIEAVCADTLLG